MVCVKVLASIAQDIQKLACILCIHSLDVSLDTYTDSQQQRLVAKWLRVEADYITHIYAS